LRPPLQPLPIMKKERKFMKISDEIIMSRIFIIRDKKVMLDKDLAELYGVTTKRLNEQVKRNAQRFPEDFMFLITPKEKAQLILEFEQLAILKFSPTLPYAFTEHGAVMLASVLNSVKAIKVNIQIVRVFISISRTLADQKALRSEIEKIRKKVENNRKNIELVFAYLDQLLEKDKNTTHRKQIGYKANQNA
jgi:hypothetical protein